MSVTSQIYNNIKRTLITLDSSDSQGLVHVLMWNDQGLSWNPRVFYLPNFATKQQCEAVIDMAKPKLKPSTLALRKGETAETTQNVRTRLKKTYIRLNSWKWIALVDQWPLQETKHFQMQDRSLHQHTDEDESGVLAAIEEKIALATRFPKDYYEVSNTKPMHIWSIRPTYEYINKTFLCLFSSHSTSWGISLARSMIHIMMLSIQQSMVP